MTSLPPNHPQQPADSLTNRYTALQEAFTLANERFEEAVNAGDVTQTRALKNSLENALRQFREEVQRETITLDDGRMLLKHEHEGLKAFAKNNKLRLEKVLAKVIITDGSVTEVNFDIMGLTTLEGLGALHLMIKLAVRYNRDLTSLHGVPTHKLKELDASNCGLTGDLSAIANATKLELLSVWGNLGLTSLHGVPTNRLKGLYAYLCGLTGDLSAISNATKLEQLSVEHNRGLTSLNGVPTERLKGLYAVSCGLTGNLSAIAHATELESLHVAYNPNLNRAEAEKTIEKLKQHSLRKVDI